MSSKTLSKFTPTWRYRLCVRLVSPLLLLHIGWRSCRDGGLRYIKERLGYHRLDKQKRIHVHAASVGEVITVLPLIEKIQLAHPALTFLFTTNTPTGSAILKERLQGNATQAYLPIDFAGATQRFFAKNNISAVWIVETEIWPWLFARAKHKDIPVCIVNARLSQKSSGALANFFEQTYARALKEVVVLARSGEDAMRYTQRGASAKNVLTTGNLKYAQAEKNQLPQALLNRPYVLAASTHDDEELQLARAWLSASMNQLLVIAPRHPERGAKLAKSLNALQQDHYPHLPCVPRRSLGEHACENCKLYLADTLGEMHDWYAHATVAFVGGSLIKRGGHNVLEPARVQTPIVVGPHTYNFVDEVALLQSADAISIADNADDIVQLLSLAVSDERWAHARGLRAKTVVNAQSDVLDRYIASLLQNVSHNLHR